MISTRILIRSKIIHPCHSFEKWRNYFYFCYLLNSKESRLQSRERAKRKIEKNKKIFKGKTQLKCLISIHIKRFCFFYCAMPEIAMMIVIFCLFVSWSHHLKNTAQNSLCVVCPKRKRKSKFRVFQQKLLTILIRLPVYMTHYLLILLFAFCISFIPSFHYFLSPR